MHGHRRRTHTRSGAASVEATLVLPVLAIALLGVMYLGQLYAAQADARALTRRCGLEHAANGCGRIPVGCDEALSSVQLGDQAETNQLRQVAGSADSFGVLGLPLISDAVDALFGTATRAHVERDLARPWGNGRTRVASEFVVLCNEPPRDVGAAVERVFCDLVPLVKCP